MISDEPDLDPALPEMVKLRDISARERPHPEIRSAVHARVRRSLFGSASPTPVRRTFTRRLLAAVAATVTVPVALAATPTGRQWLVAGLEHLTILDDAPGNDAVRSSKQRLGASAAALPANTGSSQPRDVTTVAAPSLGSSAALVDTSETNATSASEKSPSTTVPRQNSPLRANELARSVASQADPAPSLPSQLRAERQLLEMARLALARGDYATASSWCARHRRDFPTSILEHERQAIESLITQNNQPTDSAGD